MEYAAKCLKYAAEYLKHAAEHLKNKVQRLIKLSSYNHGISIVRTPPFFKGGGELDTPEN